MFYNIVIKKSFIRNVITMRNFNVINLIKNKQTIVRYSSTNSIQGLKSWKEIPGPPSLPIVGSLQHYLPGGFLHDQTGFLLHKELYERYGPIVKVEGIFGSPAMIYLYDAEGAAKVLRGENDKPIRPALNSLMYYRHVYRPKHNNVSQCPVNRPKATGLFSDHGDVWKDFRSAMNPLFLNPKVIHSYEGIIEDVARDMIKRLKYLLGENDRIQNKISDEINLWSLETMAAVALGDRINCLDMNLPPESPAIRLVYLMRNFFTLINELDFKPNLSNIFRIGKWNRAMKNYANIEEICNSYVNQSIEKLKRDELMYKGKGFLEKTLALDQHYAKLMVADMLFGGIDTGSNAVLSLLYLLAKHQDVQKKLRGEIMSKSGKAYLKACMKESMRLMPVANGNARKITKDYNILGYRIPKDVILSIGHQLLCSLESSYPNASEFIPERWLVEKDDPLYYGNTNPFSFSPFGFGIRSCIGRRLLEKEMEVFVSRMVENFVIGWDGPPPNVRYIFVNAISEPFYFTFKNV